MGCARSGGLNKADDLAGFRAGSGLTAVAGQPYLAADGASAEFVRPGVLVVDQEDDPAGANGVRLAGVLAGDPVDDGPGSVPADPVCDVAADRRHGEGVVVRGDRDRHPRVPVEVPGLA